MDTTINFLAAVQDMEAVFNIHTPEDVAFYVGEGNWNAAWEFLGEEADLHAACGNASTAEEFYKLSGYARERA